MFLSVALCQYRYTCILSVALPVALCNYIIVLWRALSVHLRHWHYVSSGRYTDQQTDRCTYRPGTSKGTAFHFTCYDLCFKVVINFLDEFQLQKLIVTHIMWKSSAFYEIHIQYRVCLSVCLSVRLTFQVVCPVVPNEWCLSYGFLPDSCLKTSNIIWRHVTDLEGCAGKVNHVPVCSIKTDWVRGGYNRYVRLNIFTGCQNYIHLADRTDLFNISIVFWRNTPQWTRASSFTRFLDHTQRRTTVGSTPPGEWSARQRDLCLTTHNTYNRQTSMSSVGFEPTISGCERPKTARPLGPTLTLMLLPILANGGWDLIQRLKG